MCAGKSFQMLLGNLLGTSLKACWGHAKCSYHTCTYHITCTTKYSKLYNSRLKWNFLIRCETNLPKSPCDMLTLKGEIEPLHTPFLVLHTLSSIRGYAKPSQLHELLLSNPLLPFILSGKSKCPHVYPWSKEYGESGYSTGYKGRRMHGSRQRLG